MGGLELIVKTLTLPAKGLEKIVETLIGGR
jgi:hypothetical protein